MTRQEFVERFEILVGKVQGVEMKASELIRELEVTFKGFGKAFSDDFILDTVFKLWTLIEKEDGDDFEVEFDSMVVTVNCINVGDKVKPLLITYAQV